MHLCKGMDARRYGNAVSGLRVCLPSRCGTLGFALGLGNSVGDPTWKAMIPSDPPTQSSHPKGDGKQEWDIEARNDPNQMPPRESFGLGRSGVCDCSFVS